MREWRFSTFLLFISLYSLNAQTTLNELPIDSLWARGERLFDKMALAKARAIYQAIVARTEETSARGIDARERLGMLALLQGNAETAIRRHRADSSLIAFAFGAQSPRAARNEFYLAKAINADQAHWVEVVPYYRRAFDNYRTWGDTGLPRFFEIMHGYLIALRSANRVQETIPLYAQLSEMVRAQRGVNGLDNAKVLMEWGGAHAELMQPAAATEKLEAGLAIALPLVGYADPAVTAALFYSMTMQRALGNDKRALHFSHRATVSMDAAGYPPNEPGRGFLMLTQGDIHLDSDNIDSTRHYYQSSLAFFETHYMPSDYPYQVARSVLGNFYYRQGRFVEALDIYDAVIEWKESNPSKVQSAGAFDTYNRAGICAFQLGQYEKAIKYQQQDLKDQTAYHGEEYIGVAMAHQQIALTKLALGDDAGAESAALKGVGVSNNYLFRLYPFFSADVQRQLLQRYRENEALHYRLAFRLSTPAINAATYDHTLQFKGAMLQTQRSLRREMPGTDPETDSLYSRWQRAGEALAAVYGSQTSEAANRKQLRQRYDSLGTVLARRSANRLGVTQLRKWEAVRDRLRPGEATLEVFNFDNNEIIDTIKREQYVAYLLYDTSTAPLMIPLFEKADLPPLNRTRTLYGSTGEQTLRTLLLDPLLPALVGVRTLYYAPSGILHRINLGAVPVSATETLSDRIRVHRLISTGQLVTEEESVYKDGKDAVVIGGIDFGEAVAMAAPAAPTSPEADLRRSYRPDGWPYLPWTAREAAAIERLLKADGWRVRRLEGEAASEASLKTLSGKSPRVLHLATHGYFFPESTGDDAGFAAAGNPLIRSGLLLAGGNRTWSGAVTPEGSEDGVLTALELSNLDLRGTELVVLSACDTGLGDIAGSEGVYGLQRALQIAGAEFALVSLWRVDDETTYAFMEQFYRYWIQNGHAIPEAYRMTQRAMRRQFEKPFNPRAWAGFVLLEQ